MTESSISLCFLRFQGSESWTPPLLWRLHLERDLRREELLRLERRRFPPDAGLATLEGGGVRERRRGALLGGMASNSLAALKASTTASLPEPGLVRVIPSSEGLSPSMKIWRSLSEKPRKSWMVMPHLRMRSAMEDTTALLMYLSLIHI